MNPQSQNLSEAVDVVVEMMKTVEEEKDVKDKSIIEKKIRETKLLNTRMILHQRRRTEALKEDALNEEECQSVLETILMSNQTEIESRIINQDQEIMIMKMPHLWELEAEVRWFQEETSEVANKCVAEADIIHTWTMRTDLSLDIEEEVTSKDTKADATKDLITKDAEVVMPQIIMMKTDPKWEVVEDLNEVAKWETGEMETFIINPNLCRTWDLTKTITTKAVGIIKKRFMKKTPSIIPQEEEVVIEEDVVPAHSHMNQQIFKSKMINLLKLIIKKKEWEVEALIWEWEVVEEVKCAWEEVAEVILKVEVEVTLKAEVEEWTGKNIKEIALESKI